LRVIDAGGIGVERPDPSVLTEDTIIYVFGLTIASDADVNLGGATIYYLPEGRVVGGIPGTGFKNHGHHHNGRYHPHTRAGLTRLAGRIIPRRARSGDSALAP
jgi:hypothetical protein